MTFAFLSILFWETVETTESLKNIAKKTAGQALLPFLKSGMKIGVGTGSTVNLSLDLIHKQVQEGLQIKALPTSKATQNLLEKYSIPIIHTATELDLSFDGADCVDSRFNLIKGLGGALTREKMVAEISKEYLILIDQNKLTQNFDQKIIPVEVLPFLWEKTSLEIQNLGVQKVELRMVDSAQIFLTDNQNYILDVVFDKIEDLQDLNQSLKKITGVVSTGLFLDFKPKVLVGKFDGTTQILLP